MTLTELIEATLLGHNGEASFYHHCFCGWKTVTTPVDARIKEHHAHVAERIAEALKVEQVGWWRLHEDGPYLMELDRSDDWSGVEPVYRIRGLE